MTNADLSSRIEEELFRKAFEEGPLGMAVVRLDYRFVKVNTNFCRMLGYTASELKQLTFPDITHPEDIDSDVELASRLIAGAIPHYRIVKRYYKKDGGICWISLSASLIRDAGGNPLYGLAMIEDITQQRQVEQDLKISEERFRTFADAIDAVAWIAETNPERVVYVNSAFERIWGYPAAELYRDPKVWMTAIHLEDRPLVQRCFEDFLEGGTEDYRAEFRVVRPDGGIRWIVDHGVRMPVGPTGKPQVCGIATDITKRKESEREAREAESRFRSAFEHAAAGMALVSREGRFLEVNRMLCDMLGYSEEEMLALNFQELTHADDLEAGLRLLQELRDGKRKSYILEKRYLHKSGEPLWGLVSGGVVRGEQGQILYFIAQIQDINERKCIEQEREMLITELQQALARVKTLSGLLPICASCKKIRDDKGYWNQIEQYISNHIDVIFSHSVCPDCARKLYPELYDGTLKPGKGK